MEYKNFINGKWVDDHHQNHFPVYNPSTGEILGNVPKISKEQVSEAIDSASAAFPAWSKLTAEKRGKYLKRLYQLILNHKNELGELITLEQGKPLKEAIGEVVYGAGFVEWYSEEAKRIRGDMLPSSHTDKRIMVIKQPVGVVAAITPWNFPFAMITRKIAPALAAGCTVIIKPASQTPLCAIKLIELLDEAGFPKGVVNLVTGDSKEIGETFLEDFRVRKITFTGSTAVGKHLYKSSAATMKRLSLELGGHAPFILFDDGNMNNAVAGAIASKFRNCGQVCIASNRFYIHSSIKNEFIEKLVTGIQLLKQGDGLEKDIDLGPLIDGKAYEKISSQIKDAVSKGAVIECGGKGKSPDHPGNGGYFYEPTVLSNVTPDMKIYQEETFGPVLPIIEFKNDNEVIEMANATTYGLAAYLYTESLSRGIQVSEALEYGIVGLNDGAPSSVQAPFGGFKESGLDREGGHYGIEPFLETKYISIGL